MSEQDVDLGGEAQDRDGTRMGKGQKVPSSPVCKLPTIYRVAAPNSLAVLSVVVTCGVWPLGAARGDRHCRENGAQGTRAPT